MAMVTTKDIVIRVTLQGPDKATLDSAFELLSQRFLKQIPTNCMGAAGKARVVQIFTKKAFIEETLSNLHRR